MVLASGRAKKAEVFRNLGMGVWSQKSDGWGISGSACPVLNGHATMIGSLPDLNSNNYPDSAISFHSSEKMVARLGLQWPPIFSEDGCGESVHMWGTLGSEQALDKPFQQTEVATGHPVQSRCSINPIVF